MVHKLRLTGMGLTAFIALILACCFSASPAAAETLAKLSGEGGSTESIEGTVEVLSDSATGLAIGDAAFSDGAANVSLYDVAIEGSFVVPVSGTQYQARAHEMLELINAERASKGVDPLAWSSGLEVAAIQRSAEISLLFSHNRPQGADCYTAFPDYFFSMGENIAKGNSTAEATFNQWKSSPGHYANMVRENFTHVGIACFYSPSAGYCWVQCFGGNPVTDEVDGTYSGYENIGLSTPVSLPDSIITDSTWTAASLTPGVGSMRQLPSAHVTFDGAVGGNHLTGDVTYDYGWFSWSTDNQQVAMFTVVGDGAYALGVSEGRTTYHATLVSTTRLDESFPVTVTEQGAFTDVSANSTDHAANIFWLSGSGVTAGYDDGSFRPYIEVARCDMAAFLRRLANGLGIGDAVTWSPSQEDWKRFEDIDRNTPHAEDVLWLAHAGISTGFSDDTFRPYDAVARCDMAAFLRRLASKSAVSDAAAWEPDDAVWNSFTDVSTDTPHIQDVLWLAHSGISEGFPDGRFAPFSSIVRCDMAAFLERLFNEMS